MVLYINKNAAVNLKEHNYVIDGLQIIPGISGNTKFNLQIGKASFYINGISKSVVIDPSQEIDIPSIITSTNTTAYVFLTSEGAVSFQSSSPQSWELKNKICLGAISSMDGGTTISGVFPFIINNSDRTRLRLEEGIKNLTNTKLEGISGSLRLKINAGKIRNVGRNYFTNKDEPDIVDFAAQNPITFTYLSHNGQILQSNVMDIDNKKYLDSGNNLANLSSGNGTIQYAFTSAFGNIAILYGNGKYNNITEALRNVGAESVVKPSNLSGFVLLAAIVVKTNTTDLTDTVNARIICANQDGLLGGAGG